MRARFKQLPDRAVRCLAWLCLFLTLWPGFGVAANAPAPAAVPVVTHISGAVAVHNANGTSRDILSSQIIHSGDMLVTGVDSLAQVSLADVGKVRLGPASTATALATGSSLSIRLASGSLCVESQSPAIRIEAGLLAVAAGDNSTVFNLIRGSDATKIAVYQGQISTSLGGKRSLVVKAGDAVVSSHGGNPVSVPIQTVQADFVSLKCPDDVLIARAVPSPAPSAPSSGGGGGGGAGGILGILLGLGAIAAAIGHGGGGGGGGGPPSPTPTPGPGVLTVAPSSLSFLVAGAPQPFTASESNYFGPINASSGNKSVATVAPASGTGPGVTFTVTPTGAGSTSITVTDNHGQTQTVSVTVTPPGSLSVNPTSLSFLVSGPSQQFTARESSYTGPINAASSDTTVATVAPASGSGPGPVTFTVTPVGAGTTSIVVTDNHGGSQSVAITVVGPLTTNPTSLAFLGTSTPKDFKATDPAYTGVLSASSDNLNVATVASVGPAIGPGPVTFRVTPVGAGNATITVTDTFGGSATVSISVSTGGLTINPTNLTLVVGGPTQSFTASEANYHGTINATPSDPSLASVAPSSGTGPGPITFTVTPLAASNTSIAVTDDHGGLKFEHLTITGPMSPTPSSLTFNGTTASQTINVSDPNYFGSITASSTDITVATVTSPGTGPNATFSVTPVNRGTATINFSDANGGSASVSVTVISGPLLVSTSSVTLTGVGSSMSFTASETNYTGAINAASLDTAVATVSPASGGGPGPVTFTITAAGAGTTTVNVTDNHGGLQPISVSVVVPPTLTPPSLSFSDVSPGKSASLSQPGYTGTFSIVGNTCAGIATVGPVSGPGPSASVPVTPLNTTASGGTCQFKVQDDAAPGLMSGTETVTVGPFGTVAPTPTAMTFTDVGTQTFTVSESGYTGSFNVNATACSGVATVSPSSGTSFTVTPVKGGGPCNIIVGDDHTQTASVSVTVGPFGAVVPSPTSLNLTVGGANGSFTVTESGYTGSFTTNASACAGFATVTGTSPTFTVVPGATAGNCAIVVSDGFGASAKVFVFVTSGSLTVSPPTLQFANSGSPPQTFTATDPGATTIFVSSSDTTIAIVSPAFLPGPSATFTVSPGISTGKAFITVTDNIAGSTAVVSIGVGVPPLIKKRAPISVHNPVPTPKSTPKPSPSPRPMPPEPRPFGSDSPRGPARDQGSAPGVPAPVRAAPLNVSAANITLSAGVAGQPIIVSEQGYSRFFTASTSNAAVATVNVSMATGPTATFAIVAHDPGVAIIRFADDHGGVRMVMVTVREPMRAGPRAPGKAQPL